MTSLRYFKHVQLLSIAYVYLFTIALAESITSFVSPVAGVALHLIAFGALIVHSAIETQAPISGLLLSLALVPLVRIVSLGLPLGAFSQEWWYLLTSIPLLAASLVIIHSLGFSREEIGFRISRRPAFWLITIIVSGSGILIGAAEYRILDNSSEIAAELGSAELIFFAITLTIGAGLTEELIFRGILQVVTTAVLGSAQSVLYVSTLFTLMHMGHRSVVHLGLVFAVALYFGYVRHRTNSLLGVVVAHTTANIMFFIILP